MQDNIVSDSYSGNIYISDANNVLCQRNLVYRDPASYVTPYTGNGVTGIMLGDEHAIYASHDITVVNNIAYGNNKNFYWFYGAQSLGMTNVLVADNTFVNSIRFADVEIDSGTHTNVIVENNIGEQDDSTAVVYTVSQAGVTWAYNNWSKAVIAPAQGTGDVVGAPLLANIVAAPFVAASYHLTASSPGISHAVAISGTTTDYFGTARDANPDMGAAELVP
jgi:hypothetical protein